MELASQNHKLMKSKLKESSTEQSYIYAVPCCRWPAAQVPVKIGNKRPGSQRKNYKPKRNQQDRRSVARVARESIGR
jgi:hypothetical protein